MSKLETNTIDTISGTNTLQVGDGNVATINLGKSGDTINVPSGATLNVAGTVGTGLTNTPAWYARRSAAQSLSNETYVKVQFDQEVLDTNGAYDNSSNYRWTCPSGQAGYYYFFSNMYMTSGENNGYKYGWLQFRRNGTAFCEHIIDPRDSLGYQNSVGHNFINNVAVGDYYEVFVYISDTSGSPQLKGGSAGAGDGNSTNFGGYKIIT